MTFGPQWRSVELRSSSLAIVNTPGSERPDGQEEPDHSAQDRAVGSVSCAGTMALASAAIDGELNDMEQAMIDEHLQQCIKCRVMFQELQLTDNIVKREWTRVDPLPLFDDLDMALDRVMSKLPEEPITPTYPDKRVHTKTRWNRFAGIPS